MDPQQPRTLRLAAPHMRGPDVAEVQRLLGVGDDGVFGPQTAGAVADWKRARGVVPASRELDPLERRLLVDDVLLRAVRLMGAFGRSRAWGRSRSARTASRSSFRWPSGSTSGPSSAGWATPGAPSPHSWLRSCLSLVEAEDAFRGDLVLFDWDFGAGDPADHVARLVAAPEDGRVRTVDGNSGDAGRVALRDRPLGEVRAFARDS
jgi:peptidoglycan hydrolase-like protein with peptidoglycan-binding domain